MGVGSVDLRACRLKVIACMSPAAVGASFAVVGGTFLGLPLDVVLEAAGALVLIGIAWGSNRQALNGLGQRVRETERDVEKLEARAEVITGTAATLEAIDGRLQRIESILDRRVQLGGGPPHRGG